MLKKGLQITISLILIFSSSLPIPAYTQSVVLPIEYFGFVQNKISSRSIYPEQAKLKGWEGVVKVHFTIAPDGRIKRIDIAESSGYPLLDAAAILAIKDASPYPFPEDCYEDEVAIILPVVYKRPESAKVTRDTPAKGKEQPAITQNEANAPTAEEIRKEILPETMVQDILAGDPKIIHPAEENTLPKPAELRYFVDLAIENDQTTKIAQQEIELAQLKVIEAQRNLLPAIKLINYYTEGEVYRIKYQERETKLQVEQPIFYSGRLKDTIDQAKANMGITQKNYDRLKLDIIHKTETAYYNLVAAKMHLREKEELKEEARRLLEKVEKLFRVGMVIPLELTSANSWFKQIEFQIKGIQQELFMAELTLKQVLSIEETPKTEAQVLDVKKLNLDFDTCLQVAFNNRPEIYLSELLMKFNDYGKRIEVDKNRFAVDLVGSYGYYSGHYITEPWRASTNWYTGFKVTKPWGGSTTNVSLTSETTQPRFGQSSATKSTTLSGELNLLDNLKLSSDRKKSDIDLYRSLSDFNETLKTINFEVQDSFLKYEKAVLQLTTAKNEMRFRRIEAEVTKVRAATGEGSLSNAIESIYGLSESQTRYVQAIANYYLSLASLKKACGYGLNI